MMKKNLLTVWLLLLCMLVPGAWAGSPGDASGENPGDDAAVILDMGSSEIYDYPAFYARLDGMPELKEVHLFEVDVPEERMEEMFTRYPHLFFGFTLKIAEHTIRTDQTAFSTLHSNKSPTHTSADFAPLKYAVRLEALDLGHNALTDISFVAGLTNIKVLILALNNIEDITPLKDLRKLEYVELFRNQIRDISPLQGLPGILDVNLGYNRIEDYTPIHSMKTLERLWLYKSGSYARSATMDKEKLAAIAQALPHCYIDAKTFPTGGGWRDHPRYFVIADIFKNSLYKPFERMTGPWKP